MSSSVQPLYDVLPFLDESYSEAHLSEKSIGHNSEYLHQESPIALFSVFLVVSF